MASNKKPSIYSDRSNFGSADELDEYGVWVKSEPQVVSNDDDENRSDVLTPLTTEDTYADEQSLTFDDAVFDVNDAMSKNSSFADMDFPDDDINLDSDDDSISDEIADLNIYETDTVADITSFENTEDENIDIEDTNFDDFEEPASSESTFDAGESDADENIAGDIDLGDDMVDFTSEDFASEDFGIKTDSEEVPSDDLSITDNFTSDEFAADDFTADDFDVPTVKSIEKNIENVQDDFDTAVNTKEGNLSTQLLLKIANELSSIRTELQDLKKEFSVVHPAGSAEEDDDEKIALTGDELDNIISSSEESGEQEIDIDIEDSASGFQISGDDDDEAIALTGDELDNILNSADFTEESGTNETVENEFSIDNEFSMDDDISSDISMDDTQDIPLEISTMEKSVDISMDDISMDDISMDDISMDNIEDSTDISMDDISDISIEDDMSLDTETEFTNEAFDETAEVSADFPAEISAEEAADEDLSDDFDTESLTMDDVSLDDDLSFDDDSSAEELSLEDMTSDMSFGEELSEESVKEEEAAVFSEEDDVEINIEEEAEAEDDIEEYIDIDDDLEIDFDTDASSEDSEGELTEELEQLMEEGIAPITVAPENSFYLEQEEEINDESIDLSDAVIDEPELSTSEISDNLTEPTLDEEDFNLDSLDDLTIDDVEEIPVEDAFVRPTEEDLDIDIDIKQDEETTAEDITEVEEVIPESFALEEDNDEYLDIESSDTVMEDVVDMEADDFDDILEAEPEIEEQTAPQVAPQAVSAPQAAPQAASPAPQAAPTIVQVSADSKKDFTIPSELKVELRNILSYMDELLDSLPEEKIKEFAKSEYFDSYKKLFQDLGLV